MESTGNKPGCSDKKDEALWGSGDDSAVNLTKSNDLIQLVTFKLGDEEYGVDILRVQEINRPVEITQVPEAPDFVRGIINLRGHVIPVVSLRKRFGMTVKDDDKQSRIVVVEMGGTIIGFMVDSVSEVLRIPMSTIEPPPSIITNVDSDYISGVGKLEDRLIILLNLDDIMTAKDIEKIRQAA